MDKKEIQARVREMILSGSPKSQVFTQLSGQGVKDSLLAYFIAAHVDPGRRDVHERKVNIVVTLSLLQALLGFLMGFFVGAKIGPTAQWVVAALVALVPLLLAWGFYMHKAGAYNAYIILSLIQFPRQFEDVGNSPLATLIAVAMGGTMLAYVWYVRGKLFPDLGFLGPRKEKGQYVFRD